MKMLTGELLENLIERTRINLNNGEKFKQLTIKELNWKSDPQSWSILECIEHLDLYGDFYFPVIKDEISKSKTQPEKIFKSGVLGNYFAKSMLPKEKLNKMKTFKDKNPLGSKLNVTTLDKFISQQNEMLDLLNKSRKVSLTIIKIPISITSLIKLRLGDTFRFVIYHNDRHILQANKVYEKYKLSK